ncbi:pyridoxal phosphate-dependent aminotransferase [Gorillibacterium massiliense]|uniref:pyridoxal phosphate-dependent aminotransferase n=1 Tax=Gorillibacterium massiliense TaxID=1280390 RepID=UPI0004B74120|nr:histidinol-phosphate transaminase [Gorillibacterium massiliense]
MIHGGDIYRNKVSIDFSVNVNPLGMPASVKRALFEAVEQCEAYPDIKAEKLAQELSRMIGVSKETILLGNGASELFMAIGRALAPKRIVIPVPSFFGYEKTAISTGAEIFYYEMKENKGYQLDEGILDHLTYDTDILFLTNPNNPVGNRVESNLLERIAEDCRKKQIFVVLDECFLEFTGEDEQRSFKNKLEDYPNVIVIRAFTKIFAIPGVRLGYLLCGNEEVRKRIERQLPEWNLSAFAQLAGVAACQEREYIWNTVLVVREEREFLERSLQQMGVHVYPSEADFLLLKTDIALYEKLLEKEILVRDCRNFRGLGMGYYRIAVKNHSDNEALIHAVRGLASKE